MFIYDKVTALQQNSRQHTCSASYVRSRIGQAVRLRLTPEIRFEYDDAYDEFDKEAEAEEDDDDGGFFDIEDAGAEADADAGPGPGPGSSRLQPSRPHQEASAVAVEDEINDDEFEEAEESAAAWYSRAGPFDDLFGGSWDGDDLAQPKQQRRRSKGSRGGGKQKQLQS
eukprot:gene8047-8242_t